MIKDTSALVDKRCLISLVFLLCCLKLTFGFWTQMESVYGNTTSEYMEIEVGSPIKLRCTLYKDFVAKCNTTSDQLIFRLRQQNLTHTIIDEYSIEYETNNATLQDNGYYQCLVPVRGYREPQLVSLAEIRVGYPPLNVTNFTCISEDFTQLNCSWNVPENAVPTTYQLYYYLVGYEW
ncbi:cytokine receptor [Caerostris darwini]|uniref:Cytokine receptor n=1 Tax=Caerostris darwini TaxID=1538125 RepID=A0AAV4P440_9ARAC|nr:cytokine receptor [Caerostris darwini]